MRVLRKNCVVLDTSIIPKRPEISDIQNLLEKELQLDMSLVTSIQPHNVKNVVFVGMRNQQAAVDVATAHHMKHSLECEGKRYPLPIYVETIAVDVRIYDLPPDMDNDVIVAHMRKYGEVITIQNEVWKSYFPGLLNGVRILKMKLDHPIPSFITVNDEVTLVSYKGQIKTCRHCDRKAHPKLRCGAVAAEPKTPSTPSTAKQQNTPSQQHKHAGGTEPCKTDNIVNSNNSNTSSNKQKSSSESQQADADNDSQWPALSLTAPVAHSTTNKRTTKRSKSIDSDSSCNETKKVHTASSEDESLSPISLPVVGGLYIYREREIRQYSHIENEDLRRKMIVKAMRIIDEELQAENNV